MSKEEMLDELTLSTGKKVTFRPGRISDEEEAAMQLPDSAGKNQFTFAVALQMQQVRMRLRSVNGNKLDSAQSENLDSVLTRSEFGEVIKYLEEEGGKPQLPQVRQVKASGGA